VCHRTTVLGLWSVRGSSGDAAALTRRTVGVEASGSVVQRQRRARQARTRGQFTHKSWSAGRSGRTVVITIGHVLVMRSIASVATAPATSTVAHKVVRRTLSSIPMVGSSVLFGVSKVLRMKGLVFRSFYLCYISVYIEP